MTLLPIYAFMLIPVWIPIVAMLIGGVSDTVRASRTAATTAASTARAATVSGGRQVPAAGTAR